MPRKKKTRIVGYIVNALKSKQKRNRRRKSKRGKGRNIDQLLKDSHIGAMRRRTKAG